MNKKIFIFSLLPLLAGAQENKTPAGNSSFFNKKKTVVVYTTAENTNNRLSATDTLLFADFPQPRETQPCVFVDPTKTFQHLMGIGGALTDASAEVFALLPKDKQEEILYAYYDPVKGIGYTLARTNIHSCDFSSSSYTYVQEGDKELKTFSVAHDEQYRIPLIKKAMAIAGGQLRLFASPWSPPGWMKDNNDMLHGGKLKPEFYQSWANYYTKFIKAYEKEGIPVWGITIQNEPMAKQTWESCIYSAEEEKRFLKKYLGPTMQRERLGNKKIMVWDHNRDLMYHRASVIFSDPGAAKYAWGMAFHWYEDWSGGNKQYENVKRVADAFPDKPLFFSEGCNGPFNMKQINDWKWGEIYGQSIINDLNNGTVGWTDWNVLLDERGGPNHVGNFCFAPVHADTKTGKLYYTNAYYYIGHFSKFIRPGATRVSSVSSRDALLTTAFKNKDGKLAVVVMNQSNQTVPYHLWIEGKAAAITNRPHSIATLLIQ